MDFFNSLFSESAGFLSYPNTLLIYPKAEHTIHHDGITDELVELVHSSCTLNGSLYSSSWK